MRSRIVQLIVLCSVCLITAQAQTVIEAESSLVLQNRAAAAEIVIENLSGDINGRIKIELLDPLNNVRSQASETAKIKTGKKTYKIALPFEDNLLTDAAANITWYRLRYLVSDDSGQTKTEGIISLSTLLKDSFELRITAAQYFYAGQTFRVRVRAVQPLTTRPVKDVRIEGAFGMELETDADEDELTVNSVDKTDGDGFAMLEFKIPSGLKFSYDSDLRIRGTKNGIIREIDESVEDPEDKGSVFLTTDKPIYQPGQSFNIRGLYFDVKNTVVAGSELRFTIKDEDETVLFRETVKTSEFGIASVSWPIPDSAKLGTYTADIENSEGDQLGSQPFKVTRYDLPNFSVNPKPDKTFYLPADKTAEVTVKADYLFGQPVKKGKVRVVQETSRRWNWYDQKYDIDEKQTLEGATDEEGKFIAKVNLSDEIDELNQNSWQRFRDMKLVAYYTDLTTNKTEQRRFDIRVSREPIHIYLVRSRNALHPDLPVTVYISTFYADGTPVVCDVEVKGRKYAKYSESFQTIKSLKTNSLGAGKVEFFRPKFTDVGDDLELQITARDQGGKTGMFGGKGGTFDELLYFDDSAALKLETEKTILKPGESIKLKLLSNKRDALVYVDVVQNWSVIESRWVVLKDGRGELKIPYNPKFKGELTVSAYIDAGGKNYYYSYYDLVRDAHGIIYPEQQNLRLDAKFSDTVYKPNEEAKVNFTVADGVGKAVESALGVVVFDKAVEERARTDAEFGSYFSRFYRLLGYSKSFGAVTIKDLNELNLKQPIPDETELAAEVMLADNYFYPRIYRSEFDRSGANTVYAEVFKKQFATLENALKKQFETDFAYPSDEASLRNILSRNGINFDEIKDPWGQIYRALFELDKTQQRVKFQTAGADKAFGTADDLTTAAVSFTYFTPVGKMIDKAAQDYHKETGGYIRDIETLRTQLTKQNFDLNNLKDRWTRDYRIEFKVLGRFYGIIFRSLGPNGIYEPNSYNSDDFEIWQTKTDYFAEIESRIKQILSQTVNAGKREFPKNADEFKQLLTDNDLDLAVVKDGFGEPVYIRFATEYRYSDKTTVENGKQKITPITEMVAIFTIRSKGGNLMTGTYSYADDFDLAAFSGVLSEQSKNTKYEKSQVMTISYSGANGAIRGTVLDANGAVIPGARATATSENDTTRTYSAVSGDTGVFLIENIPSGTYSVRIDSSGFKSAVYAGIQVRSQNLVEMKVTLEVGEVNAAVEVTSDAVSIDTSESRIETTINGQRIDNLPINGRNFSSLLKLSPGANRQDEIIDKQENSTPRLREYFPETLVWNPELITDKNGKAELKFKLADNITTWKLYAVASTKNGKIGIAEREIQAFQSFFADLDPPKFLTTGDEIYLPTQIRNYTESKQKVNVTMAPGDWFSFLNSDKQQIEVASGDSENAIFGFKANRSVKGGKQRVTAIAAKESDAIEKPVTVRPNGQEIVRTDSKLFSNSAEFDLSFPANALSGTQKAEVKIYPNLFSHVTEAVEGLLQRPYGCGEQTISSTYPNLMILKFKSEPPVAKSEPPAVAGGLPNSPNETTLEKKAKTYLLKGYERLLGYQVGNGGFSYWGGKDEANIALTAYAIRFLRDAGGFIEVDENVITRAQNWLIAQQNADGSFTKKYYWETSTDSTRTKLFTSYVARTLAMQKAETRTVSNSDPNAETRTSVRVENSESALQKALAYLKQRNSEIDEPYALALFGLASLDAGNVEDAQAIAERLSQMAIPEGDAAYWKLETNTPFYGWGTAGRIETTALVVQLLTKISHQGAKVQVNNLISRGTLFLLKNKDRYGVWYSTQTTINVLDTFLLALGENKSGGTENSNIQIFLNGENIQNTEVAPEQIAPVTLDLTGKLNATENRLEIKSSSSSPVMAQAVENHYIDWRDADLENLSKNTNGSRQLRLDYKCDRQTAEIMQEISCTVEAERIGFRGYGMLLAEIGTPPGADVSRESLEEALKSDWSLSRYDILPDRIIVYMWSQAGGTKFNFKFKPRYGINAQTPASVVYDYYNPEAHAVLAPLRFTVSGS